MIQIRKEDGALIVDHTPWMMRVFHAAFIVVGLVMIYHFSVSGRLECRRAPEGGTCTLYRSSVFQTETQTFPLQELKEASTVMVGPKSATRVDLILKGSVVEFSHRNSDSTRAKHVAAKINEFLEAADKGKLDVEQKPDVFVLFMGLLTIAVGLIPLLSLGHSTRMRFDSGLDKVTITHRGLPKNKEFKVSDIDHLDGGDKVLMLVFHDGTFHSQIFMSSLKDVRVELDAFIKEHFPKGDPGSWG